MPERNDAGSGGHIACGRVILDTRPERDYLDHHRVDAANIPLEQLAGRIHELPRRDQPLLIYDDNPMRARWARSRLRVRGFERVEIATNAGPDADWISGPARVRLWQPHALLVESLNIIGGKRGGRAIDLACGTGRDAVYLAINGWQVVAIDVLPDALARAQDLAHRNSVQITTRQVDLERAPAPLNREREFDLVTVFNYLHRPLIPAIRRLVAPGGWILYDTFVDPQRERFGQPRRAEFVLRPGELRDWFADWQIRIYREGESGARKITASLVAGRPDNPA